MKSTIRLAAAMTLTGAMFSGYAAAADITGAGATFPYPLYAKWAEAYKAQTGVGMNYQSIGSGGGIKQIQSKTVDFGASDKPLTAEELNKAGLTQFPAVMGGVVPVINLPGVAAGQLKVTGPLLADIYLGKVSKWNDPAIASLNPGVKLPDQAITVVRRSDGSGTTFIWTNYLSRVSEEWKTKIGENSAVNWPAGVGGKGNEGVANYVTRIKGSIGYVEYAYAKQNKISHAAVKNQAGNFVQPDDLTFKAAAANANWKAADGFYQILTNQPGKDSWPITGATFILMHKKADKPEQSSESLKFFDWAYANGDKLASDMDYVPMPDNVKKIVRDSWKQITDTSGKPVWK
ncbi:phosphate ABC transporter substrate-binding protein PstS [Aquaspirillum sp. LM1]|jgi:phosphate transport system substrate-binding protein|uniref:phosphate ABC transporter substrate-binding protein PstS n=1 Tax=Aquaspirillum sp. LM1 TaxID=1938604 RepID=UPI000983A911|nr:phosphate ABC transporter substrate-binding protein PstS [Aquaspirillum sp. LM1]AQR65747.1 phosphate ABC transporter substrate-binding protein PstS [Aquaspirillum sp. LM1]